MALRGSLEDVPIADVLQFVNLSGKSGTLVLISPEGQGRIEFSRGNVVFAQAQGSNGIGALLQEKGHISEHQLNQALERQQGSPDTPLGELLVASGDLERSTLEECLREQIQKTVLDLARLRSGEFHFGQQLPPEPDDLRSELGRELPELTINTQFLVLEAARLLDEGHDEGHDGGQDESQDERQSGKEAYEAHLDAVSDPSLDQAFAPSNSESNEDSHPFGAPLKFSQKLDLGLGGQSFGDSPTQGQASSAHPEAHQTAHQSAHQAAHPTIDQTSHTKSDQRAHPAVSPSRETSSSPFDGSGVSGAGSGSGSDFGAHSPANFSRKGLPHGTGKTGDTGFRDSPSSGTLSSAAADSATPPAPGSTAPFELSPAPETQSQLKRSAPTQSPSKAARHGKSPALEPVQESTPTGPASRRAHQLSMALVGFERASWAPLVKALRSIRWRVLGHSPISRVSQALGSGGELARVRLLLWQVKNDSPQCFDSAHRALSSIAQLPLAPTQVVVGRGLSPAQVAALYSAGARAVFPVEDAAEQALTLGLGKLLSDIRADQFKLESAQSAELKTWLHAKQLTQGMQEALQRANIALELMRVASTSLERAVFFLKKEDELIGLGAFGLTSSQTPMADALRGMALKIPGSGQLRQVLELRRPTIAPWQELGLGSLFFDTAGRPAGSEAAVIPVLGSSRVIALVYGDNGPFNRPITNLEPLEMVAGQAGMAYENALLRMQLGLGVNTALRPEPERSARALQSERSGDPVHTPQQG